jgi:NAD+ kinase
VLAPDVHALVVTPACAHTLGSRALVLGTGATLSARLLSPGPAVLMLDGQASVALDCGDEVEIRLARRVVRVHENPDRPFLHKLQAKLGWQGSERRSM